jgi:hypothetical protein
LTHPFLTCLSPGPSPLSVKHLQARTPFERHSHPNPPPQKATSFEMRSPLDGVIRENILFRWIGQRFSSIRKPPGVKVVQMSERRHFAQWSTRRHCVTAYHHRRAHTRARRSNGGVRPHRKLFLACCGRAAEQNFFKKAQRPRILRLSQPEHCLLAHFWIAVIFRDLN